LNSRVNFKTRLCRESITGVLLCFFGITEHATNERLAKKINDEPTDVSIRGISSYSLPRTETQQSRIVIAEFSLEHLNITNASFNKDESFFSLTESKQEIKVYLS
jgi:hypothetical protein